MRTLCGCRNGEEGRRRIRKKLEEGEEEEEEEEVERIGHRKKRVE